jgi:hypothetical protein
VKNSDDIKLHLINIIEKIYVRFKTYPKIIHNSYRKKYVLGLFKRKAYLSLDYLRKNHKYMEDAEFLSEEETNNHKSIGDVFVNLTEICREKDCIKLNIVIRDTYYIDPINDFTQITSLIAEVSKDFNGFSYVLENKY